MKRLKKQSDINNINNKEGNLNIEYDNDDKIHENLSIESDASFLKKQDDDNLKKLNNNPFIIVKDIEDNLQKEVTKEIIKMNKIEKKVKDEDRGKNFLHRIHHPKLRLQSLDNTMFRKNEIVYETRNKIISQFKSNDGEHNNRIKGDM